MTEKYGHQLTGESFQEGGVQESSSKRLRETEWVPTGFMEIDPRSGSISSLRVRERASRESFVFAPVWLEARSRPARQSASSIVAG